MPPKPKPAGPSKKVEAKKKEKIIEDKTFGLKNKKGAKNQKFIQQVQQQVKFGSQSAKKAEELKKATVTKKEEKQKQQQELNELFRPVVQSQKVEKGVDPKSVLCAFYKQGQCTKGDKCKFSHDLNIEKKAEKKNIYVDTRELSGDEDDGDEEKVKLKTKGICKHFLDAVESNKYGWFWVCPNGGDKCQFRHALPEGYQLNRDKPKEEKKDEISIEDLVETERANLPSDLTKITLESFMGWKKRKIQEKRDAAAKLDAQKKAKLDAGKNVLLSGRDVFTFRPEMANEDAMDDGEAAFDTSNLKQDDDDEETVEENIAVRELTLEELAMHAREADGSGTVATEDRRKELRQVNGETKVTVEDEVEGASGGVEEEEVPVDESLFADEDLDELEENIESLEVSD